MTGHSANNTILENDITFGSKYAIRVKFDADNIVIRGNSIRLYNNSQYGISILHSDGLMIVNISISGIGEGISIYKSSQTLIEHNTIDVDDFAIRVGLTPSAKVYNNTMTTALYTWGDEDDDSYVPEIADNTVNGKPIYYSQATDAEISGDYGQILLIGARSITLNQVTVSNVNFGLILINSSDIVIKDSSFSGVEGRTTTAKFEDTDNISVQNSAFDPGGINLDYDNDPDELSTITIEDSTVNGEELLLVSDMHDKTYSSQYGQVIIIESTNITVHPPGN